MLVLTRRVGEALVIAGGIRVQVLSVQGGQVRLGVSAPASVRVLRTELLGRGSAKAEAAGDTPWPRDGDSASAPPAAAGAEPETLRPPPRRS